MQNESTARVELLAFGHPLVRQLLPRERVTVALDENESWPAFPSRHGGEQCLRERNPDLQLGLLLKHVDSRDTVMRLKVRPAHVHQVDATLTGVDRQGDGAGQVCPGMAFSVCHLFVAASSGGGRNTNVK